MRLSLPSLTKFILICCCVLLTATAFAGVNGAIYTTDQTGSIVNGEIYGAKTDVYLNGGPQNQQDPGLVPDGTYYFQVTDPSGAILLSADDISCRQVVVLNGRIVGVPGDSSYGSQPSGSPNSCTDNGSTQVTMHALGTFNPNNNEVPVQLCPSASGRPNTLGNAAGVYDANNMCDSTPNPGGVYKVWLTPIANYSPDPNNPKCSSASNISFGFCDSDSKTDTFKVKKASAAYVSVCKFNDLDGNGTQDPGEPFIPGWPITATGVDTLSGPIGTVYAQTDATGCVSFSVSDFTTDGGVVTLTEGFQTGNWQQTAPAVGAYNVPDGVVPPDNGTVAVNVATNTATPPTNFETLTLAAGDDVAAPNFGNTCLDSTCGGNSVVLTVTKDANPSLTRTYAWSITKSVDNASVKTAGGAPHTFNYTVDVTHDPGTDSGWQVTGTIKVTNPSMVDVPGVTVSDSVDNGGSCTVTGGTSITVPANSFVNVPYVCTYASLPANGTNTATATDALQPGTASIDFSTATIKFVDNSVNVTDTLGGALGTATVNADGTMSVSGGVVDSANPSQADFTYAQTFTDPAGTCTSHPNTATFTTNSTSTTGTASQSAQDCQGADLTVTKTAAASFTRTYNWTINKSVDQPNVKTAGGASATVNYTVAASETGFNDSGWQVNGTITVTNPNDWEAVSVTLSDAINNGGNCTVNGGAISVPAASGGVAGQATVSYTCTYASAPSPSSFTNTASATWDKTAASTPDGAASGSATGSFGAPTTLINQTVTITDTVQGQLGTLTATDTPPYTSHNYTYSRSVTGAAGTCTTFPNTAKIVETGQTSNASVKDCQGADLTVSKTATASFTSGISKSADKTTVQQSGGNITFNYTVTGTESAWTVSGNITVNNPNDWEAVTATLADSLAGATCSVNGGNNSVSVPASGSASLPYSCTFSSRPSSVTGTNNATATWNATSASTPDGSASGSAVYSFKTLTITDTVNSSSYTNCSANLGTMSVTTTTASTSPGCGLSGLTSPSWGVFKYSVTDKNAAPATCTSYNNTAQIMGGSSSNQVTVTVCNTNTGALTMGFWKNNNGQGLISATNQANLQAFLTSYNPFKDYPTKAGQTLAQYVASVLGAATCGGSTCNPMLKAQMLATALDVYFSNPVNGDPIKNYNGGITVYLGNVAIDLSHVCAMVDGGSGSSCSGSFENARPEFGIAPTCQGATLNTMLGYSDALSSVNGSPVSNSGGSNWYQQSKTPQVIAKDAFDSTNNSVANIATGSVCTSTF